MVVVLDRDLHIGRLADGCPIIPMKNYLRTIAIVVQNRVFTGHRQGQLSKLVRFLEILEGDPQVRLVQKVNPNKHLGYVTKKGYTPPSIFSHDYSHYPGIISAVRMNM